MSSGQSGPMRTKFKPNTYAKHHSFGAFFAAAVVVQFAVLAGYAQPGTYLFTGSERTITLNPGLYDITAFGAQGGNSQNSSGAAGAKMVAEFSFTTPTTVTLLVGGAGSSDLGAGSGGGG